MQKDASVAKKCQVYPNLGEAKDQTAEMRHSPLIKMEQGTVGIVSTTCYRHVLKMNGHQQKKSRRSNQTSQHGLDKTAKTMTRTSMRLNGDRVCVRVNAMRLRQLRRGRV